MSKMPAILSATLTVSLVACGGGSDTRPIGQPVTMPLITRDGTTTGTGTVFNSTNGLFITADSAPGWELAETRLAVALSLECIPHSQSGEPQVERFLLRKRGGPGTTTLGYNLPLLVQPGTELFIALYADVRPVTKDPGDGGRHRDAESGPSEPGDGDHHSGGDDDGEGTPAWAQGLHFPGDDGSMYFTYVVRAPAPASMAGLYTTYTQISWGAPMGSNPASNFLSMNFMGSYPGGLTLGSSPGNTAAFMSIEAIDAFLPESGAPAGLMQSYVNPPNLSNPFAGELLALTLNLSLDSLNTPSGSSRVLLSALVIADPASPLYGLTVGDVVADANLILGGLPNAMNVTMPDVFDALSRINANFENGTVDLGFLSLP